jgi:hypothetical protein
MNGRHRVIDEVNFNLLGTFDSRGDAIDYVAALLTVNDDSYLDELTITSDEGTPLTGESLRTALQRRAAARERVGASGGGGSYDSQDSGYGGCEAMTAKGRE